MLTRWGSQIEGGMKGYNPKHHGRASHPGLQVSQLRYQPHGWDEAKRLVVVRQHMQCKVGGVPGKTLSLFADDPDLQGWR